MSQIQNKVSSYALSILLTLGMSSQVFSHEATSIKSLQSPLFSQTQIKQAPRPFSGIASVKVNGKVQHFHDARYSVDTPFIIGSLSKQMTAALVMQAVDAGKLSLDAKVSRYVQLGQPWQDQVTIKQLLAHTSGVVRLDKPLLFVAGSQFKYSNAGYDLLGMILSEVTGSSFSALAGKLFDQCNMPNTIAKASTEQAIKGLISGYHEGEIDGPLTLIEKPYPVQSLPSGGIVSTINDLHRWNSCLHQGELLSESSYTLMTQAHATRKHRWGDLGYGFGIQIQAQPSVEFSHSGYVIGYIATLTYVPESKTSMVLLENTSWYPRDIARVFYFHDQLRENLR